MGLFLRSSNFIFPFQDFLGYPALSDDKFTALLEHLSFGKMRANDAVNMKPPKGAVPDEVRDKINFIRKGKVGGWVDDFEVCA